MHISLLSGISGPSGCSTECIQFSMHVSRTDLWRHNPQLWIKFEKRAETYYFLFLYFCSQLYEQNVISMKPCWKITRLMSKFKEMCILLQKYLGSKLFYKCMFSDFTSFVKFFTRLLNVPHIIFYNKGKFG